MWLTIRTKCSEVPSVTSSGPPAPATLVHKGEHLTRHSGAVHHLGIHGGLLRTELMKSKYVWKAVVQDRFFCKLQSRSLEVKKRVTLLKIEGV